MGNRSTVFAVCKIHGAGTACSHMPHKAAGDAALHCTLVFTAEHLQCPSLTVAQKAAGGHCSGHSVCNCDISGRKTVGKRSSITAANQSAYHISSNLNHGNISSRQGVIDRKYGFHIRTWIAHITDHATNDAVASLDIIECAFGTAILYVHNRCCRFLNHTGTGIAHASIKYAVCQINCFRCRNLAQHT